MYQERTTNYNGTGPFLLSSDTCFKNCDNNPACVGIQYPASNKCFYIYKPLITGNTERKSFLHAAFFDDACAADRCAALLPSGAALAAEGRCFTTQLDGGVYDWAGAISSGCRGGALAVLRHQATHAALRPLLDEAHAQVQASMHRLALWQEPSSEVKGNWTWRLPDGSIVTVTWNANLPWRSGVNDGSDGIENGDEQTAYIYYNGAFDDIPESHQLPLLCMYDYGNQALQVRMDGSPSSQLHFQEGRRQWRQRKLKPPRPQCLARQVRHLVVFKTPQYSLSSAQ